MTFRESQPVDFFFLCLYRSDAILHLLACTLHAYHHFYKFAIGYIAGFQLKKKNLFHDNLLHASV